MLGLGGGQVPEAKPPGVVGSVNAACGAGNLVGILVGSPNQITMSQWRYVNVTCGCGKQSSIRIDQFNRSAGCWTCRTCAYTGRVSPLKGSGIANDKNKQACYNSYQKAKRRVRSNHKGRYANVEFRFDSFEQWFAELGPRPEGCTVDRIDNTGHYEPGNIRWATSAQQSRNRTSNVILEYNGQFMCMTDAAKASGIPYGTLERRVKAGCPPSHLFVRKRWRDRWGNLTSLEDIK